MNQKKSVLCVGCTVIDFVTIVGSYPKEDTDRRCLDGFWQRGGNASNVSTTLRVLGTKVDFFGILSSSDAFRVLLEDLRRRGIGTRNCPLTSRDPPFSSVILSQDTGSRTIIHCNKDYPQTTWEDFIKIDLSYYGWVHFEARNTTHTAKMMQSIREYDRKTGQRTFISLDFETRYDQNLELCHPCDYVIFSKELATDKGWTTPQQTCQELAADISGNGSKKPIIICPWGSDGAVCLDSSGNFHKCSSYQPEKVVDTLGAGDSFVAGFIKATFEDQRCLREAVDYANRIASRKIEGFGYDHINSLSIT
ncbi:ketohexokinase [Drosophila serrata]|uniref:ketohexokinase n=1 Tax=Drosophila serrata TaxID=7274 RepID=UPI000A1D00BE|nr:ketohexokinase [Drosophila serrata]XP_020801376.1 ketohexokinase [Drosophila serrata]XP_020801377.1 ketohexokinase [Drosophila serrata]